MNKRSSFNSQNGQAVLTIVVFLLSIGMSIVYGVVSPTLKQSAIAENFIQSSQSYVTSESGIEDVIYRLKKEMQTGETEVLPVASSTATTTITSIGNNEKSIISLGNSLNNETKSYDFEVKTLEFKNSADGIKFIVFDNETGCLNISHTQYRNHIGKL